MISRRLVVRVAQIAMVVVLGLWAHNAEARVCTECDTCNQYTCPAQVCADCPRGWFGSCYAGSEGCGAYANCQAEADCCGSGVCLKQCYCPPCP